MQKTYDLNVVGRTPIITPEQLRKEYPMTEAATRAVMDSRKAIQAILRGDDPRLMIVTGPCSIISERQAIGYGERLAALQERVDDTMKLVMRVYFEKPRTNLGF